MPLKKKPSISGGKGELLLKGKNLRKKLRTALGDLWNGLVSGFWQRK